MDAAYKGLQYSEQTSGDGSVTYLGAKIYLNRSNRLSMEVFDKFLEWDIPVLRYPHAMSNAPLHQTTGIYIGQLRRIYTICNAYSYFKVAVSNLTKHMVLRGHKSYLLLRGWNVFMTHHARDSKTNRENLRRWYRSMLFWARKSLFRRFIPRTTAIRPHGWNNQPIPVINLNPNPINPTVPIQPLVPTHICYQKQSR
jgi:hypothetical protein